MPSNDCRLRRHANCSQRPAHLQNRDKLERIIEELEKELELVESSQNRRTGRLFGGRARLDQSVVEPDTKKVKKIKQQLEKLKIENFTSDVAPYNFGAPRSAFQHTPGDLDDSQVDTKK